MKRCEGPDCENEFEPKRSTARFCSSTCRTRARRAAKAATESVDADTAAGKAEHTLVTSVRKRLGKLKAADTVEGQLALQLARRIADPDTSGVSALSKELLALIKAAKEEAEAEQAEAAPPTPAPEPPPDDLDVARRRREEKAAAAAAAAEPVRKPPAKKRAPTRKKAPAKKRRSR